MVETWNMISFSRYWAYTEYCPVESAAGRGVESGQQGHSPNLLLNNASWCGREFRRENYSYIGYQMMNDAA